MERPLTDERPLASPDARLAQTIRAIRRERGLTQQQVADNWGMTVDGYRPWERDGQRSLKLSQIPGLARALTVSEDELAARLGIALPRDDGDGLAAELRAMGYGDGDAAELDALVA